MENLVLENSRKIRQQLWQLGFANGDEILKTAQPLYTAQNSAISGINLVTPPDDRRSDKIEFAFELGRMGKYEEWKLKLIKGKIEVKTDRAPFGHKSIARYWHINEGPLPHIKRMKWILTRMATIEAAKESFLLDPKFSESPALLSTPIISPLNSELATAFKNVGFQYHSEMLRTANFQDDLIFLTKRENIDPDRFYGHTILDTFFAVVYPDNRSPLAIEYFNASIPRDGPDIKNPSILIEKDYWLSNGELPTKDQILHDILSPLQFEQLKMEKAARIMTHPPNTHTGQRLNH